MMRILWIKNEKKYYDDKVTCGGERALQIAKRHACLQSPSICRCSVT